MSDFVGCASGVRRLSTRIIVPEGLSLGSRCIKKALL